MTKSYKNGGYCVAGFDTETKEWIRLVASEDPARSELPKSLFDGFDYLEILEVEVLRPVPYGCQRENFLMDLTVPPVRRGRLALSELLSGEYLSREKYLFGNPFSFLNEEEIARVGGSLVLIKAENLRLGYYRDEENRMHYRSSFTYRGRTYSEISVTDPVYRRDELAETELEAALLVVSLPGLPYSNGNFYKFIDKLLPLRAEDSARADRTLGGRTERRPFVLPPKREIDLPKARRFLSLLAEKKHPETGEELDMPEAYADMFGYCARRLYGPTESAVDPRAVYILRSRVGEINTTQQRLTASALAERINAVREPYGKKVTSLMIAELFESFGLLSRESGKRLPDELGTTYDISYEIRHSPNGVTYPIVLYGQRAQAFLLDNIEAIATLLDEETAKRYAAALAAATSAEPPSEQAGEKSAESEPAAPSLGPDVVRIPPVTRASNYRGELAGKPWTPDEEGRLVREFMSRLSLEKIAERHKRSVGGIRARLMKLGLLEGE